MHPLFDTDPNDLVFQQWIEEAFDRKDLDLHDHQESGYDYIKFQVPFDSTTKFFDHYFANDFEETVKRKVERNEFKYELLNSDMYSYDKSWVDSELRSHDLDVDDADIDHLGHQQAMIKNCLDSIDEQQLQLLEAQILYAKCMEKSPDILALDDELIEQEKVAQREFTQRFNDFKQQNAKYQRQINEA